MSDAVERFPTGRVVVGAGISEEFSVSIGLGQRSPLNPLLCIRVVGLVSRNIIPDEVCCLRKIIYEDHLSVISEKK